MAFNHYAKMKRILAEEPAGWYVRRFNEPTSAKNFKGETVYYDHYYRVYSVDDQPVKYCKFQKLDTFAQMMEMPVEALIATEDRASDTIRTKEHYDYEY